MIRFTVPAVPVAQPRARATVGPSGHARVYEPKQHPVVAFKATVRTAFCSAYDGPPIAGPVQCDLVFVMPRPKSMIWKTKPMPRVAHIKKPDRDNLDKAVMDALTGLAWRDDCQVCCGTIQKVVASGSEQPHVEVSIGCLDWI